MQFQSPPDGQDSQSVAEEADHGQDLVECEPLDAVSILKEVSPDESRGRN